ncbi:MAG: family 16 glycoside hydrolase [Myxococcales bacterium]|jgi:hypothetical protein
MRERAAAGSRRASVVLLVALASCATAHEASLPAEQQLPDAGAGGSGATGGKVGVAGSAAAGKSSSSSGAPSAGGAPTTGGAPNGTSGAAGANTAGSHTGGSAGAGGGGAGRGGAPGGGAPAGGAAGAGTAGGGTAGGGSAGSGSVLFSDDFEDGNANGWTASNGTWAIATDGSKVYSQTGTGTGSTVLMSSAGTASWTNQIIEAKIKVKAFGGSSTSYFAAIYGRYNGTDYYSLTLRSDGKIAIRKNTTTLGSAVAAGIVGGTWYTVRLEIVGSSLKAYVNGALVDTETDATLSAGRIAVGTVNTTAEFDDIKVTTP